MAHVKKTQQQHHFRHNTTYKPPFSKNRRVRYLFFSSFFNLGLICCHYIENLNENCFPHINWILNDWLVMDDLQITFFAFICFFFACWNFGIFIIFFIIEARCF